MKGRKQRGNGKRQERNWESRRRKGRTEQERRTLARTPHSDLRDQEGVNKLVELRSGSGF